MSEESEEKITNEINKEESYSLIFQNYDGKQCNVKVSLSPDDTVDAFVKKVTPFFYDQNFLSCDGSVISQMIFHQRCITKQSASKPLNKTPLWKTIKDREQLGVKCELQIRATFGVPDENNSWIINYKPKTCGELPLYKVESEEEAANSNKKHNQFRSTGEFVELSLSPRLVAYNSPNISASNPLHRFIYSDHLRTQYDEGRLANAEGIFNRKIDSEFGEQKTEGKDGKIVTQCVAPRGWQGIDKSEYLKVNGKDECHKDAQAWYKKLDDIILDKAYLSVDKNLDTLISAANHFYEEKKITFEQFTNVMLMLRYAYELRKLPNDKDANELNSDPKPIKLSQESYLIIEKIFAEMKEKLILEFDNIKNMISDDQMLKDDNKELNLIDLNNNKITNFDPAQENGDNKLLEMFEFVIKNKNKENELISKLKERNQNYIDTLTNILNSKLVEKSDKEGAYDESDKKTKCYHSSKDINKDIKEYVDKIKKAWEETKHEGIDKFIQKLDSDGHKPLYFKASDEDRSSLAKIKLLLSDSDKNKLNSIKDDIDNLSNDLDEHKKILDSETFKKCAEYVEMYACVKNINKNIKDEQTRVTVELSWGQRLVNLILSIGHLLAYRFYQEFEVKIDRVVDFKDKKDDIFSKFNRIDLERYRLSNEEFNNQIDDLLDEWRPHDCGW